ncbi:MAG: hypothetical protein GF411_14470 [Candidatus Lokiarchaeota archaeon]|nr:hypothetical protein [Candidatus Lokiarchaeota archaeon]
MSVEKHVEVTENGIIVFRLIELDDSPTNPLEDSDAMGTIYSFCNKHRNFIDPEEVKQMEEDKIYLSYHEHGLCRWFVRGSERITDTWDTVDTGGVWVPDKYLLDDADSMGLKQLDRQNKMSEWANQACDVYTKWCNGDVYGVVIKAYKAKYGDDNKLYDNIEDYRHDVELYDNSCWGYYGIDEAYDAMKHDFHVSIE